LEIVCSEGLRDGGTLLGALAAVSAPASVLAIARLGSFSQDGTKSDRNHQGAGDEAPSTSQV